VQRVPSGPSQCKDEFVNSVVIYGEGILVRRVIHGAALCPEPNQTAISRRWGATAVSGRDCHEKQFADDKTALA